MSLSGKFLRLLNIVFLCVLAGYLISKAPWDSTTSYFPQDAKGFSILDSFDRGFRNDRKRPGKPKNLTSKAGEDYDVQGVGGSTKEGFSFNCTNPFYNFAFVKTHKCASDTLSAYFMRLADENNLELILPTGKWNLMWPYYPGDFYHSRKANGKFDMTVLHMMYYPDIWRNLMEPDAQYISVVRQPYRHFKSFFNYFSVGTKMAETYKMPVNETFDLFLSDPEKHYIKFRKPYWKNPMLFDFGYKNEIDKAEPFIEILAKKFSLVMISDYFDESMIVLKHQFCLTMKDILLKVKNISKKNIFKTINQEELLEEKREESYKKFARADYVLFNTFNQTLWDKIELIPKFDEELAHFRKIGVEVDTYCETRRLKRDMTDLVFPESEFNEKIVIDREFCQRSKYNVLVYIDELKKSRYTKSSPRYSGRYYPK